MSLSGVGGGIREKCEETERMVLIAELVGKVDTIYAGDTTRVSKGKRGSRSITLSILGIDLDLS